MIRKILASRLGRNLLWNYLALAVLGGSGIAINLLIARYLGAEALGVFNQVYACFVIVSQIAVLGMHLSMLRDASILTDDGQDLRAARSSLWAALPVVLALGVIAALLQYLSADAVSDILDSPRVADGLRLSAPGLLFFALNKVLLAAINGLQMMRAFALGQILRFALLLAWVAFVVLQELDAGYLPAAFTFSEGLLTLSLLAFVMLRLGRPDFSSLRQKAATHLHFGIKGFLGGILVEVHSRVDVLILGLFLSDQQVGIYSFIAMIGEGFLYLMVAVRDNLNPILARHAQHGAVFEIEILVSKVRKLLVPAAALLALLLAGTFPVLLLLVVDPESYRMGWLPLAILMAGLVAYSGFMPFDALPSLSGHPGWQTGFLGMAVSANIVFNLALVPMLGLVGAALGTALAFLAQAFFLKMLAYKLTGVRL